LTEIFISAEISHGVRFALRITVETLFLAVISYLIMDLKIIQSWVLFHPEATIISLLSANILLGKFTGLRLLEYWRFRELLRK
ncbi:MAG TPA: 7TM domain-containing protein, partial [Patescibacteria group bacterium]|nr:7TM domain-containing protein [Patescibacteria group bacterium]